MVDTWVCLDVLTSVYIYAIVKVSWTILVEEERIDVKIECPDELVIVILWLTYASMLRLMTVWSFSVWCIQLLISSY
jgi:hypothetical protein